MQRTVVFSGPYAVVVTGMVLGGRGCCAFFRNGTGTGTCTDRQTECRLMRPCVCMCGEGRG